MDGDVSSTTVTAETTDDDATKVITINGVEDADGTVDLVAGYNVIAVVVTAQDGTTTRTYTVTVLRAQPDDDDDSTDDTITSLLSRMDAGLLVSINTSTFISHSGGDLTRAAYNSLGDAESQRDSTTRPGSAPGTRLKLLADLLKRANQATLQ